MYFTQDDYKKIEKYLQRNGKKDTDFPSLDIEDTLKDDDILTVVRNNKNYKILLLQLIASIPIPSIELSFKFITQDMYDSLEVYDSNTLYFIIEDTLDDTWVFGNKFPIPFKSNDSGQWVFGGKFPINFSIRTWLFGHEFPIKF